MNDAFRYMQIDDDEFLRAVRLWEGGADTLDIARALDRHESVIANQIGNIRTCAMMIRADAAE